jgi:hypothetical protein
MDGHVSKDLFQIDVGERAELARRNAAWAPAQP